MIPGEVICKEGLLTLNEGRKTLKLVVANTGDRPVQVGSHYHFYEVNPALIFERELSKGYRLNIASGTAIRFEPGQYREVELVAYAGLRRVFGFRHFYLDCATQSHISALAPASLTLTIFSA